MVNKKLIFIFFGPQASGKGTQGKMLAEELNLPHISTGRLIRQAAVEDNYLNDLMETGQFIPDEKMLSLLRDRLESSDAAGGFILDGYPRNMAQADLFENYLEDLAEYKLIVFNLLIDSETILKRVAGRYICSNCGRNYNIYFFPPKKEGVCDDCGAELIKRVDDTEEVIKKRHKIFLENTQPVIDFYKAKEGIHFFDVNGEQDIPEIFNDIKKFYYDEVKNK